jgi:hypothetical protein
MKSQARIHSHVTFSAALRSSELLGFRCLPWLPGKKLPRHAGEKQTKKKKPQELGEHQTRHQTRMYFFHGLKFVKSPVVKQTWHTRKQT